MKANERHKQFKKGIDTDATRRRREDTALQIRKTKREERLNQRRRTAPIANPDETIHGRDRDIIERLSKLTHVVSALCSPDTQAQLAAATEIRQLLSFENNPPIQEVIDSKAVPIFVEFLKRDEFPELQFQSAWALTNIASGTSEHTRTVIEAGSVPLFSILLLSRDTNVREQAIWALGNISGDSPEFRDIVIDSGSLQPIVQLLDQDVKLSLLRNATWTISNFCRGKPQPDFSKIQCLLPVISQIIYSQDEEVLIDACWALSYLTDGSNEKIQSVIETGVMKRVVELLAHPSTGVQTPALRAVGNVVTGNDIQTQLMLAYSVLPNLHMLLSNPKKGIRKEACWTISNITAGNADQIMAVINANIIPTLLSLLSAGEFDVRKEACWAVSNATNGGGLEVIRYLVSKGCLGPMCDMLTVSESKMIIVALEGLENILKAGEKDAESRGLAENSIVTCLDEVGGIDKIQNLQYHETESVYEKSVRIVERYFGIEDENEVGVPTTDPSGTQLQFGTSGLQDNRTVFDFTPGK